MDGPCSHHCLSAFCPPATRTVNGRRFRADRVTIAFRRSVPRPRLCYRETCYQAWKVTIAFRRSVPRPPVARDIHVEMVTICHHCLSAFCPPATRLERSRLRCRRVCHHCLSAFCPPATFIAVDDTGCIVGLRDAIPSGLSPLKSAESPHSSGRPEACPTHEQLRTITKKLRKSQKIYVGTVLCSHHCLSAFCPPAT